MGKWVAAMLVFVVLGFTYTTGVLRWAYGEGKEQQARINANTRLIEQLKNNSELNTYILTQLAKKGGIEVPSELYKKSLTGIR